MRASEYSEKNNWLKDKDNLSNLITEICKADNVVAVCFMKRTPHKALPKCINQLILNSSKNTVEKMLETKFISTKDNRVKVVLNLDPLIVKKKTLIFEKQSSFGVFVDIDVFCSGKPITRVEMGEKPRPCLVCSNPAKQCIILKRHSLQEVNQAIRKKFFNALRSSIFSKYKLKFHYKVSD